jgi:hypothetical protein
MLYSLARRPAQCNTKTVLSPFTKLLRIPESRRLLAPHQLRRVSTTAKLHTDCSGRRTGKSFSGVLWCVEQWAERGGQSSIFIALSQEHAIRIAWDAVEQLNRTLKWGAVYNGTDGTWTWPNGFTLYFMGCKDRRSANFVRGVPKIHRVLVDECGQIPDPLLKYLIEDVVEPTMADTDGDIGLQGTPADTGVGFYEDTMAACEAEGAHFCATAADNPHLEVDGAEYLARMLAKRFGGDANNATYRREYLGHRVQDEGVLIYRTPPLEEFYDTPPPVGAYTTMGIDIGWNDGAGFCVLRSRAPQPGAHIIEVYREEELSLPRMAAIAERMRVQHGVGEIFVDTAGGGGATIMNTLAVSYGLPAVAADKRARRMRIEQVRSMLDARTLRGSVGGCGQILEEWRGLPWSVERDDHRPGYVDECTDALQYALQGAGHTTLTTWRPELTPEQVYQKRVADIQRNRRQRTRGGRR